MKELKRQLLFGLFIIGVIVLYACTLAPDLTWANNGYDGGDFVTAAATGGVAHPSGYPTYLMLARLFLLLPFGSPAFRVNLLSAVMALGTVGLAEYLVSEAYARRRGDLGVLAGLTAGWALAASAMFWSQAVITEVYAPLAFFLALVWALLLWGTHFSEGRRMGLDALAGLVLGLGTGVHLTAVFLLPLLLSFGLRKSDSKEIPFLRRVDWARLGIRVGGFLVGASVYFLLLVWGRSGSPVIWGEPTTLKGLFWLVSGKMYQMGVFGGLSQYLLTRLLAWMGLWVTQFGLVGFMLGLVGLFWGQGVPVNIRRGLYWQMAVFSFFAIVYVFPDSNILLIPANVAFAPWIGVGVVTLWDWITGLERLQAWRWGLVLVVLVTFGYHTWQTWPQVDARQDQRAGQFMQMITAKAPKDALIFLEDEGQTFSLWYAQYVLGHRPDLAIVSQKLVSHDWYRQKLRDTYPGFSVPDTEGTFWDETIAAANDRPVCYVDLEGELFCLSEGQ